MLVWIKVQGSIIRRYWPYLFGIISIYLVLTFCRATTTTPWNDEAWYTSPSRSLILHGDTGTPLLETDHNFWRGIDKRTYWVVPLQFYAQVPWILLFGFSLVKMRAFAIAWGVVAMCAWGYTTLRLTANVVTSLVAMLIIACDFQFDSQVSLARMDAMSLGLASLAVALFVGLRERNLKLAIFCSQLCVAACGLTHPTPGIPAFTGLAFLTLSLDWRRLRIGHILLAIVPYLLGAAFWGWYISEAPDLFKAQFFGNVGDMDRLGGLTHPVRAIARELGRYWGMAGFATGMNPLYRIKAIAIAVYVLAAVIVLVSPQIRRSRGVGTLIGLWATYLFTFVFYEGTKEVKYAIHIVCIYDVLLAVAVVAWWQLGGVRRLAGALMTAAFIVVSTGGLIYSSLVKDDYHKEFLPVANYLRTHAKPSDLILAESEFGFPLGFDSNIVDDDSLTYNSHKQPQYIVLGANYKSVFRLPAHAAIGAYARQMIDAHYHRVYGTDDYEVLRRNDAD